MGSGLKHADRRGFMQRLSAGLIAGIAVMVATVIVITALSVVQDYRDALRETAAETQTVARALEQHSERVLDAIRFRLRLVQQWIGSPDWEQAARDSDLHGELAALADRPFVHSVWLFDETGLGRVSSRSFPAPPAQADNRDYFTAQRDSDRGIYIGRPITGRHTGDNVFSASVRLTYDDGRFAGVAALFIRPEYFQEFYRDLQLGKAGAIELLRADGAFLIREPSIGPLGELAKPRDYLERWAGKESGTYRAKWPSDGVERISSFRRIVDLPLVVHVGMSADHALEAWRTSLVYRLALAALALAATLAFGRVIVMRARAVESEVGRRTVELERSVREKDVLLREVHHRVKNNLQMIASMLRLTARTSSRESQPIFADIARRVTAIGQAYNQLYRVGQVSELNLAEYIGTVAHGVAEGFDTSRITVRTELEEMTVDIDTALPVGLIALELVTNAFKHAFPGDRSGEVVIKLQRHEGYARLVVADNGVGIQAGAGGGSGLMLIEALAGQVDGKLRRGPRSGGGMRARLTFRLARGGGPEGSGETGAA